MYTLSSICVYFEYGFNVVEENRYGKKNLIPVLGDMGEECISVMRDVS